MMLTLYLLMMGVSAFTIQPEERTVAAGSCQDRGKHFKTSLKVEGEPVVLRCPQARYWLGATASPRGTVTWRKSGSAVPAPGEDGRVWVQDGDLWILPAQRGDSGTYLCTVRNASYCDQMALDLRVLENTDASLPAVSYPQVLTVAASGSLVCPELSEFAKNKTDLKIQWYKVPFQQVVLNYCALYCHEKEIKGLNYKGPWSICSIDPSVAHSRVMI